MSENKKIKISCAPSDNTFAKNLKELLQNNGFSVDLLMRTFEDSAPSLSKSALLITIDIGAVHIGPYYNIPTYCVFTSEIMKKWHSLNENIRIFY